MKINEHTALLTPTILLVPYYPHHVPTYHEWMQDPALQAATASEPLSLDEEYAMQKSWRTDADKLTFIVCEPPKEDSRDECIVQGREDAGEKMVGDVNLFLTEDDDEDEDDEEKRHAVVGEVEIMIASKSHQGRGLGREILLVFTWYILSHVDAIVQEYRKAHGKGKISSFVKYLRVKIDAENARSMRLFESVGFVRIAEQPNYFGEMELRWPVEDKALNSMNGRLTKIPKLLQYRA